MKAYKQMKGRTVGVWLPDELYIRFLAAREAFGFRRDSTFAKYIIQSWLEQRGYLFFPSPRPSPPAEGDAEQRGLNPGDVPGSSKVKLGGGGESFAAEGDREGG